MKSAAVQSAKSWRSLERVYPNELIHEVLANSSTVEPQTRALRAASLAFDGRYRQVRCTQGWLDDVELELSASAAVRLALWLARIAQLRSDESGFLFNANPAAAIQAIQFNIFAPSGCEGQTSYSSSDALGGRLTVFLQVLAPKPRDDALYLGGSGPTLSRLSTALLGAAASARSGGVPQWLLPKQEQACPDTTLNSCIFAIGVSP